MKRKTVTYGNGFLLADHTQKSTLPPALSSWSVHLKSVLMFLQRSQVTGMQREVNTKHFSTVIYLEFSNFTAVHRGIAGMT